MSISALYRQCNLESEDFQMEQLNKQFIFPHTIKTKVLPVTSSVKVSHIILAITITIY